MVVSSVDCVEPPEMKLPSSANRRLMRPSMGAFTCVNSRLSSAALAAAWASDNIGHGDIVFVPARIKLLRSNGAALHQLFGALEILQSEIALGFRPLEFSPGAFGLGLVRPGIDHKQGDRPPSPPARP